MKGLKCKKAFVAAALILLLGAYTCLAQESTLYSRITGYVLCRPGINCPPYEEPKEQQKNIKQTGQQKELTKEQEKELTKDSDFKEIVESQIKKNPEPVYVTKIDEDEKGNIQYTLSEEL